MKKRLLACLIGLAVAAPAFAQSAEEIFREAMAKRGRGELHEAIRGFHAILAQHPGLNRARLELAVAYYQLLDHAAALEHARAVLADPATPPAVRANVERLVAAIEAEARPHAFSGFGSAGLLYDSNVTAGPASPAYELGGSLVSLDSGALARSDQAVSLALGGSHRYLAAWRPQVGGRDGALLWQSQAMVHRLDYLDESDFDLTVLTLTTGPAWISPPRLRVSAPLQYDRLELGSAHYLDILGVAPAVVASDSGGTELQLDVQLQERDYKRDVDFGRDSGYAAAGLQLGRVISGMTLQAGARYYREDADAGRWDSRGTELFALVARQLGSRASAYVRLAFVRTRYDEPDPIAAASRRDRERRLSAGVSYRLPAGRDEPWSASLTFLDIEHRSDIALYAFDRRQLGLTLTRAF